MKDFYGPGSHDDHEVCPRCGMCIPCRDCVCKGGEKTDQEIVKFLARELMGWALYRDETLCPMVIYQSGRHDFFDWNPLAQTRDGYFQCFGPGGVLDKMEEKGWWYKLLNNITLNGEQTLFACYFCNSSGRGIYKIAETKNRAVCLAADLALKAVEE